MMPAGPSQLYAASPKVGRYVFEALPQHGRTDVFTALAAGTRQPRLDSWRRAACRRARFT
jgi:hypothetical protein